MLAVVNSCVIVYTVKALEGEQINSTEALTPIQQNIPERVALDRQPSQTEHSYFVTAVDESVMNPYPALQPT